MEEAFRELNEFVKKRLDDLEKDKTKEQYIESRDNFLRTFNELLYGLEQQYPEGRDLLRARENDLWRRIDDELRRIDITHNVAPLNLSRRDFIKMLKIARDPLEGKEKDLDLSGVDLTDINLREMILGGVMRSRHASGKEDIRDVCIDYGIRGKDYKRSFDQDAFTFVQRNLESITIDETTILTPEQLDYLMELSERGIRIDGLEGYLAHHRPAAPAATIASAPINIPRTTTEAENNSVQEDYRTPNSSVSDHFTTPHGSQQDVDRD